MKYTRKWKTACVQGKFLANRLEELTDAGWSIFAIMSIDAVEFEGERRAGGRIVAFKDEPDLSGGVPR